MIYTITFSPSLDYLMTFKNDLSNLNRSNYAQFTIGGKGLNASIILTRLKIENQAITFLGGFTGRKINKLLIAEKVTTKIIKIKNQSRVNVKTIFSKRYEFNAQGPVIIDFELNQLLDLIKKMQKNDVLLLMGKINHQDLIKKIIPTFKKAVSSGIKLIVDASGRDLKSILEIKPYIIKPNLNELEELFNQKINSIIDIKKALIEIYYQHQTIILVSLGKKGAIYFDGQRMIEISAPQGVEMNATGAGDSFIAGFVATINQKTSLEEKLKLAAAAGAATAFSNFLATKSEIEKLIPLIKLREMEFK